MSLSHPRRHFLPLLAAAALLLATILPAWPVGLQLPAGLSNNFSSRDRRAFDLSSDGNSYVGQSDDGTIGSARAVWWSSSSGTPNLIGSLSATNPYSIARGLSTSASVIVGESINPSGFTEAFRWTSSGGISALGDLSGGDVHSVASAVSADGSVIVGYGTDSNNVRQPVRWTQDGSVITPITSLAPTSSSTANAVSANGSVIVGRSADGLGGGVAFRWTAATGIISLGDLPGGGVNDSFAAGVSSDGSIVVGTANDSTGYHAVRWDSANTMTTLQELPSGSFAPSSQAFDTSADGFRTVGQSRNSLGIKEAVFWSQDGTVSSINTILLNAGINGLNGWTDVAAYAISDDGTAIAGTGIATSGKYQSWLVTNLSTVPEPSVTSLLLLAPALALLHRRRRQPI